MKLTFTDEAWDEYLYWQTRDKKILKKINTLLRDAKREPFTGLGKPEPLKHELAGYWSRRITQEHRLVYEVFEESILVLSCCYHY